MALNVMHGMKIANLNCGGRVKGSGVAQLKTASYGTRDVIT